MLLENSLKKILIIDFGSQFTQLIARKVRELGVYCEIISHHKSNNIKLLDKNVSGLISVSYTHLTLPTTPYV